MAVVVGRSIRRRVEQRIYMWFLILIVIMLVIG